MNTFFKGWQIPKSMRIIMTLLIYNTHCSVFQLVVFQLIWTFLKIGKVCTVLLFSQSDSNTFFKCTCIITKQKVCNHFFFKLIMTNAYCQSVGIVPVFPRQQNGLPLGFSPKTADKLHTTFPDSGLESLPENSKLGFQANNYFPYDSITVTIVCKLTCTCKV